MYRGSAPAAGLTVLVTQWEPAWAVPGCGPDIVLLFLRFEGAEAPYALADPDFGINYFPGHRNKNSLPLLLLPVQLSTLIVIVLVIAGPLVGQAFSLPGLLPQAARTLAFDSPAFHQAIYSCKFFDIGEMGESVETAGL
jgi:hypothetical protein